MITDGNQTKTGRYTRLSIAVQGMKSKGVTVYAVGVGRAADMAELLEIASAPEYVFRSQSFKRLQNLTSGLRGEFCVGNDLQMFEANTVFGNVMITCNCLLECDVIYISLFATASLPTPSATTPTPFPPGN